jgi:hypothetical protein
MKKDLFFLAILFIVVKVQAQNVGIGTTTPVTKLHVVGTGANIATFSGGSSMYITLAEGASNRGYIGSFAGNSEDIDFGTYAGNATGKIHLTIQDVPKFTLSPAGNIGLGELNPVVPLNFASTLGNKISFWGTGTNHYGLGIQNNLMQVYTPSSGDDISFGTGNSAAFLEKVRFKGNGTVGIGTATPEGSSLLDVVSTTKGITMPRLTSVQRDAIVSPATGLIVYDLNYNSFFLFDGVSWMALATVNPASLNQNPQAPGDLAEFDLLGIATGIDSLYAIVGAPYQNGAAGAAYIYKKTNNVWAQMAKLIPDVNSYQYFGNSVSIDFPYAVVGAPEYNGSQGAVYIFYYNGSAWVQLNKFFKPGTVQVAQFGNSVDIDNNFIVVGAPAAGNIAASGGAAFTYKLSAGVWSYHNTITHASIAANNSFGFAVAISDSFMVIGSPLYDNGAAVDEGRAYHFKLSSGGTWDFLRILIPFYNADVYNGNPVSVPTPAIKYNWNYREFGYSVDIKYNKTGGNSEKKVFTVVGAPGSYFQFNATQSALNMGLINIFTSSPNSLFFDRSLFFGNTTPAITDANVYLGSSVSFSDYKGNLSDNTASIALYLLCGSRKINNYTGKVDRYRIDKDIMNIGVQNGPGLPDTYTVRWYGNFYANLESSYSGKTANDNTGYACGIFDANSYIVGIPGLNVYKGGIIFKF